jgi:hypothetical protein
MAIKINNQNVVDDDQSSTFTKAIVTGGNYVEYGIYPPINGTVSGYSSGGAASSNVIDKFPFAADANATDVGDLTQARFGAAGQSSDEFGYTSGGSSPVSNVIDKFPFAADANATDVGDLTQARQGIAGQQD